jgi:Ca2+-transporting ATPase
VIQLLPGDAVPADARVITAHRLQVEESALTGESRAVEKIESPVEERYGLADRRSMVYRGTTVVGGRASAVIVATGARTAIGTLHVLAAQAEAPPTPMERDLAIIGRGLAIGATVVCGGIFGIGIARGLGLLYGLEVAVSLGVAAIPEGLPTLATSVLAFASGRMRRKGTLIRSLGAAEALGSVTVVCADKTGTLTENRMAARELFAGGRPVAIDGAALAASGTFAVDGEPIEPRDDRAVDSSLRICSLCSDAEVEGMRDGQLVLDGSATEGALLVAAVKAGLDPTALREAEPRIDLRDRSDGRRHMVTVHRGTNGIVAMCKGAPDEVLTMCDTVELDGRVVPLEEPLRTEYADRNADMAGRAMRVLALAHRTLPESYGEEELGSGYTLSGLIGLVDPIRPAVPAAVRALHRAGIRTVMITGDQALTATAVARELGLSRRGSLHVLEAGDLAMLQPEALRGLVRDVGIFARVAPEMKLEVVRALQANGEVTAMTGDGVNDGPALRAADVGVAMGERGSELARDLADVVLSTDDFSLMVDAVEEGRLVRANVRRVLHYLLSTNASEVWAVAGAVALGLPSPLTPLQLLWLNLVTDLAPGLALALEPADPELMSQPPRDPKEPIIPRPELRRILAESAAIAGGALSVYGIGIARHGIGPIAQTMAFASLLGAQLLHVSLARAGDRPALSGNRGRRNPILGVAMAASGGLQLLALFFPPLRTVLGGAPLALADLGIALGGALLPSALVEVARTITHGLAVRDREAGNGEIRPASSPPSHRPPAPNGGSA